MDCKNSIDENVTTNTSSTSTSGSEHFGIARILQFNRTRTKSQSSVTERVSLCGLCDNKRSNEFRNASIRLHLSRRRIERQKFDNDEIRRMGEARDETRKTKR